nr:MAG TPA: hypothetical protein [Caudoviricetes sp.]
MLSFVEVFKLKLPFLSYNNKNLNNIDYYIIILPYFYNYVNHFLKKNLNFLIFLTKIIKKVK